MVFHRALFITNFPPLNILTKIHLCSPYWSPCEPTALFSSHSFDYKPVVANNWDEEYFPEVQAIYSLTEEGIWKSRGYKPQMWLSWKRLSKYSMSVRKNLCRVWRYYILHIPHLMITFSQKWFEWIVISQNLSIFISWICRPANCWIYDLVCNVSFKRSESWTKFISFD